MKFRLGICFVTLALTIFSQSICHSENTTLTISSVSQQILKQEGYQFFTFSNETGHAYQVVAKRKAKEDILLNIRGTKELIIAVKLSPELGLQTIKAFSPANSVSMSYNPIYQSLTFSHILSQSVIALDAPFITLDSATDKLELWLVSK